jgi:very-short-patch-repair endonuclease
MAYNTKKFIEKAKKIHSNKYDYSKVEFVHINKKVKIICPIHGEFEQTPHIHLQGHGCPRCGGKVKLSTNDFIEKSKKIHGDKYDYSKVEYKGNFEKVCIICPKHGEFWQHANQHMQGRGCPHCRQSSLEKEVREFLDEENIKYISQKRAKWLGKQSLDFYLPEYKVAIECQGIQHFIPSEYFGGEKRFERTKKLDSIKNKICEENGIKIIYYSHYNYKCDFEMITDLSTLKDNIYGIKSV